MEIRRSKLSIADDFSMEKLGLGTPTSPLSTIGWALSWLALMLAYSPLADRLATRLVSRPPTLDVFRTLQASRHNLLIGIAVAWVLGGFLEELILRGIILQSIEAFLSTWLVRSIGTVVGVCCSAAVASVLHLYQGPRAVIIVTQLSVLFGVLFVMSGHDLWAVIACHGLYDTIAFIRFANKQSKYSRLHGVQQ